MRVFSSAETDAAFEKHAAGKMSAKDNLEKFKTYNQFERYQFEERKPVWVNALITMSGCRKQCDLELQWDLFGDVFRRFHSEQMEWLVNPASCPPEIREEREAELEKIISSFATNGKCHWRRNHEIVCFCGLIN